MGHTKKHIILDHLAKSKGLSRKNLVTFICKLNGYEGHKQGYYGTNLQGWAYDGYIQKKDNKWYITPLGKTYLKTPKVATLKASLSKMTKGRDNWKDNYYELKDELSQKIKALKIELGECERKRDIERTSYHESVDFVNEDRANLIKEVEDLKSERGEDKQIMTPNTLIKTSPPQLDTYGHFTKSELIAIIKQML